VLGFFLTGISIETGPIVKVNFAGRVVDHAMTGRLSRAHVPDSEKNCIFGLTLRQLKDNLKANFKLITGQ